MARTIQRRECLRCGTDMNIGVLIERDQNSLYRPVKWHEGVPEYRGFFGGYAIKTKNARVLDVFTFHCPSCGMLESVAVDDDAHALLENQEQGGDLSLAEGGPKGGISQK